MKKNIFSGLGRLKDMVNRTGEDYDYYENELEEEMVVDNSDMEEEIIDDSISFSGEKDKSSEPYSSSSRLSRRRRPSSFQGKAESQKDSMSLSNRLPNNVVGLPGVNLIMNEIEIFSPHTFKQAAQVINILKQQRSVVLNLGLMEPYEAQRAVDFVTGGVCALDGHYDRVAESVFIFTPRGVSLTNSEGDSSLESNDEEQKNKSTSSLSGSFSDSLWDMPLPELSSQTVG